MDVVISVGGSVLAPSRGPDRVSKWTEAIEALVEDGHRVGVVVGGGAIARDYIDSARALGADEIALDDLGIAITRINARLVIAALGDAVHPEPALDYAAAKTHLRSADVCVMGGTSPGHTTDAVAAALAEFLGADLLVLATSVAGVFDADPNQTGSASQYDSLSAAELVELIAANEMNAGSRAPVDLLAAKLIDRARLRTIVLDGTDPRRTVRAVTAGDHDGTDIVPTESGDSPNPTTDR